MDLISKLQIKADMAGTVIDQPPGVALGLDHSRRRKDLGFVVVFAKRASDVSKKCGPALARLKEDGLAWFCYPKKSSGLFVDLSRDEGWEPLSDRGYRGVRQIAIDETWSALRFRKKDLVG